MKLSSTVTEIEDQKEQFSKIRKELEQVELYDLKQLESYEKKIKGQENSAQGIDATKSIESKDQQADKFMVIFQRHVVSSDLGTSISKFREWAQMEDEIRENTTKKIKTEGELKINLQIEKGEQRKNLDQNTVDGAYLQKKDIFHFTKYVKFMVIRKFCDLAQLKIQESWNQIKQDDKLIYVLNIGRVHWEDILFFNTERIAEYVSVSTDLDNLQQIACNRDQQEILSFKYRVFLIHQDIMTLDRQEQVYLLDRGTKTPIMSHSVYSFMNINLVQSVNISLYMLNCTQSLLKGGILVLIYFDIEQFCKETDLNLYKEDFEIVNNAIPPLNELQGAQNDGAQVSFTFQSKNQHIFDHLASIFPVNEIDLISEAKQLDLVVLDQFNFTEYFNQHKQLDEKTNQQFFGQTQISGLSEYGTDAKSVQIFGSYIKTILFQKQSGNPFNKLRIDIPKYQQKTVLISGIQN